jgi:hypothetical protein
MQETGQHSTAHQPACPGSPRVHQAKPDSNLTAAVLSCRCWRVAAAAAGLTHCCAPPCAQGLIDALLSGHNIFTALDGMPERVTECTLSAVRRLMKPGTGHCASPSPAALSGIDATACLRMSRGVIAALPLILSTSSCSAAAQSLLTDCQGLQARSQCYWCCLLHAYRHTSA